MALAITRNNISANEERGAVIMNYVVSAAGTCNIGDVVSLDSNNQVYQAVATSLAASRAIGMIVAIPGMVYGETAAPAGTWVQVCIGGPVQGFTTLANGQQLWVDKTTAGGLATAAPTGAYDWIVGQAQGSDTIFIRPGATTPQSA